MLKKTPRLDMEEVQEALRSAEGKLPDDVHKLFQDVITSYAYLANLLSDETMTVGRLRKMLRRRRGGQNAANIEKGTKGETPPPGDRKSPADA